MNIHNITSHYNVFIDNDEKELLKYYLNRYIMAGADISARVYALALMCMSAEDVDDIIKTYVLEKHYREIPHGLYLSDDTAIYADIANRIHGHNYLLPRIEKLSKSFKLCEEELLLIQLKYIEKKYICNLLRSNSVSQMLGISINDIFYHTEKLFKLNILVPIDRSDFVKGLNPLIYSYICSNISSLLDFICHRASAKYSLDSFPVDKSVMELLIALIKNVPDARILIYGSHGLGKSQYAVSLGEHCGKNTYITTKDTDYLIAMNSISASEDLLIIDEADDLLNESFIAKHSKKTILNQALDISSGSFVYITNYVEGIAPSVLRRFHYILKFESLNERDRMRIWKQNIPILNKFMNNDELSALAGKYDLPLGIISKSAEAAYVAYADKNKRKEALFAMLDSHRMKEIQRSIGFALS